ncbi:MAG: biotin-dependent carboxyltransferase family protein [Hyphomicrobiaceae bacterium]|nr:biotin-dependent carboxyltransferase family protein [Hyphomicrobiaceae bacterium]
MTSLKIIAAPPLATIQDQGRFGMLKFGVSASGPLDRAGFARAGKLLDGLAGAALELAGGRFAAKITGGTVRAACSGGNFALSVNGKPRSWSSRIVLRDGDQLEIVPGKQGNFAYVRFDRELDVPLVMGSRSTNLIAGLGGFDGRNLKTGDTIGFAKAALAGVKSGSNPRPDDGPIRFIWGIHADILPKDLRSAFAEGRFTVSAQIDRMGLRLNDETGVFARIEALHLVSDAVVPGDVQILGDGTPVILMRDHQPTGGYPRIATIVSDDLSRLAQMRPGTGVRFEPISLERLERERGRASK